MEEEKREHMQKMKKMEQEMEEVFKMKVQEKKQKLHDSEADVSGDFFMLDSLLLFYCKSGWLGRCIPFSDLNRVTCVC